MKKVIVLFVVVLSGLVMSSVVLQAEEDEAATEAQWIWYPEGDVSANEEAPPEKRYFVKNLKVDFDVSMAEMELTVDNYYKLYINGKLLLECNDYELPLRGDWRRPVLCDITKEIKKGNNVIAIEGGNVDGPAALILKGYISPKKGEDLVFFSDANWLSSKEPTEGWIDGKTDKSWVRSEEFGGIFDGFPWAKMGFEEDTELLEYE